MNGQSLSHLLAGIVEVPALFDLTVHGLTADTRELDAGDGFIAVAGMHSAATANLDQAVESGAIAILLESDQAAPCYEHGKALVVPVAGLKTHMGTLAARFYGHPGDHMSLVGVTGTNGKTTVSQLVAQLLEQCGSPCGVIGTLGYGFPANIHAGTHTTPDVVRLNRQLAEIQQAGGRACAMEVSSHALDQGRVDGLRFASAIFTNLSRDHLDYHGSIEAYGEAKERLFAGARCRTAIINVDDDFGRGLAARLTEKGRRVIRFSLEDASAELHAIRCELQPEGCRMTIGGKWGEAMVEVPLMGRFNASNVLAAMAATLELGVPLERLVGAVARLLPPPGRLQAFKGRDDVTVVVDYAHTPDALGKALEALREHARDRLICVFGCGGDRDSGKRPEMAAQSARLADLSIVTDDNPRTESPESIVKDIVAGFSKQDVFRVVYSRAAAIEEAISEARNGDIVLIAGKGHETYQEIKGRKYPFNDAEQVRAALGLNGGVA